MDPRTIHEGRCCHFSPMTDLTLHGRRVKTVFELLGDAEDDITYSVGWGTCPKRGPHPCAAERAAELAAAHRHQRADHLCRAKTCTWALRWCFSRS
jgi:hypothetical protein